MPPEVFLSETGATDATGRKRKSRMSPLSKPFSSRDRGRLTTERPNARTAGLDRLSTLEIVDVVNAEDAQVAPAVAAQREQIAAAVELVVERFRRGGRLFYVGAGTSGRLGVLDAAECPPTFGTRPSMVQGVIAGGRTALVRSAEGAEDHAADGAAALEARGVKGDDAVVGIAACGLTPFVHGAMRLARRLGAATIFVTCSPEAREHIRADVIISPVVGPEVVTGSTRMKAGTATKLVLNTLTTAAMVRLGKVYGHWMVDLKATNEKLQDRAERMIAELAGISAARARRLLAAARGEVKTALAMHFAEVDYRRARKLLADADGRLRPVMERATRK